MDRETMVHRRKIIDAYKSIEKMNEETLMNAESNPFKYDSPNYWKYRNNKSRSNAKSVMSQYKKFL